MFPLPHAATATLSLDEVVQRLRRHATVAGLVLIGSTAGAAFTPASDYDLVVMLSHMPVPLHVGLTYIDHRLTDVLFVSSIQVDAITAATAPLDGEAWVGRLARWLLAGQIVFDRTGQLRQAQAKVQQGTWITPLTPIDAYGAWFGVNYNLTQTRRLLGSEDPVYLLAADLRMGLYGLSDVVFSYFRVRQLRWEGDKAAIRYLQTHDPAYWALLQRFLYAGERQHKFQLYEQLAAHTLAPVGGVWSEEITALWFDPPPTASTMVEHGLDFWQQLLSA